MAIPAGGLIERPFAETAVELTLEVRPVGSPEKLRLIRFGMFDGLLACHKALAEY